MFEKEIDIQFNIEAIRKAKGLKQEEIARRLGISQGGYSHYINRNLDISFGVLQRIAKALEVSVIDVITYPNEYVDKASIPSKCEECESKQHTIDNLNYLISMLERKKNRV